MKSSGMRSVEAGHLSVTPSHLAAARWGANADEIAKEVTSTTVARPTCCQVYVTGTFAMYALLPLFALQLKSLESQIIGNKKTK
jgi:hypothetical protein